MIQELTSGAVILIPSKDRFIPMVKWVRRLADISLVNLGRMMGSCQRVYILFSLSWKYYEMVTIEMDRIANILFDFFERRWRNFVTQNNNNNYVFYHRHKEQATWSETVLYQINHMDNPSQLISIKQYASIQALNTRRRLPHIFSSTGLCLT